MNAALFRAALGRSTKLTAVDVQTAIAAAGSLTSLASQTRQGLIDKGLPPAMADELLRMDEAMLERDLAICDRHAIHLLAAGEPGYPQNLLDIADAPALLYVRGDVAALSMPLLAMVGSRNPTGPGRSTARDFAAHFARIGIGIVSGLALGIDAAAHEGALTGGGVTVAVCGTGLDIVYPEANKALAVRIAAQGALISEFPPGTPALPHHFPQRNRLISGLSLGVLVVEAARQSGSLITARCAGEQGREVFAIPGSIHSPQSRGCHELIRAGAKLVESADDVLQELKIPIQNQILESRSSPQDGQSSQPPAMDKDYEILLHALGYSPVSLDQLVANTGFSVESVASMLLMLELKGDIEVAPGGRYRRLAT